MSVEALNPEVPKAMEYIFECYDEDNDGQLQQKDFFLFLYELKNTARQDINQDQMVKCWDFSDRDKKGYLTKEEFLVAVESLYDNSFFGPERALKQSAHLGSSEKIADPQKYITDAIGDQSHVFGQQFPKDVYNTVRFKNSPAVKAMEDILQEEKEKTPNPAPTTVTTRVAARNPPNFIGSPYQPRREQSANHLGAVKHHDAISRSASGNIRPGSGQVGIFSNNPQAKKEEAQKKMEEILAAKYQEQRRQREEERKAREEEEKKKRQEQANSMNAEPRWLQDLKSRKSSGSMPRIAS